MDCLADPWDWLHIENFWRGLAERNAKTVCKTTGRSRSYLRWSVLKDRFRRKHCEKQQNCGRGLDKSKTVTQTDTVYTLAAASCHSWTLTVTSSCVDWSRLCFSRCISIETSDSDLFADCQSSAICQIPGTAVPTKSSGFWANHI